MWVQWLGTVLLLAVACLGGARLAVAGRGPARPGRASDAAHVLMATGLAAMLDPLGNPLPRVAWEALFCLVVGWSLVATLRERGSGRRLTWARHAVAGVAMIYMLVATPMPMYSIDPAPGLPGGGLSMTPLTWIMVAYFGCFASWSALTAVGVKRPGATQVAMAVGTNDRLQLAWALAPRATALCEAVTASCMAGMLLGMR